MREGLSRNKINNDLRSGVFAFEKTYISRPDNYTKGTPERSVRQQNVTVRMESKKVAEGLNGDDRAGKRVMMVVSIGYTVYDPLQPTTLDDMISNADKMMYKMKKVKYRRP